MTEWQQVQGSQEERPLEFDTTSSSVYVYQRRNIERVTQEDMEGNSFEMWQYEERKLSKTEYAELQMKLLEDELTQTQIALTEIYERLVV